MASLKSSSTSCLKMPPPYEANRLNHRDNGRTVFSSEQSLLKEQRVHGLKSQSHNSLSDQTECNGFHEQRKIRIGDLSAIGIQRKNLFVNNNRPKDLDLKHQNSRNSDNKTNPNKADQQHLRSAEYLEVHKPKASAPVVKTSVGKYNCDPINDPKYDKKLFYKGDRKSSVIEFSQSSTDSYVCTTSKYVRLVEPDVPTSPVIVPSNQRIEQIRSRSETSVNAHELLVDQTHEHSLSASCISGEGIVKHPVDMSESSQSASFRLRSISEPPYDEPKKGCKSKITKEKSFDVDLENVANSQNSSPLKSSTCFNETSRVSPSKVLSLPLKVSSFTACGHEITQEYIFVDTSQFIEGSVGDDKVVHGDDKVADEIRKPTDERCVTESIPAEVKKNKDATQTEVKLKVNNTTTASSVSSTTNDSEKMYNSSSKRKADRSLEKRDTSKASMDRNALRSNQSKRRSSVSAPTSPTLKVNYELPAPGKLKWGRSTSAGNSPENVPEVTVTAPQSNYQSSNRDAQMLSAPLLSFCKPYRKVDFQERTEPCSSTPAEAAKVEGASNPEKADFEILLKGRANFICCWETLVDRIQPLLPIGTLQYQKVSKSVNSLLFLTLSNKEIFFTFSPSTPNPDCTCLFTGVPESEKDTSCTSSTSLQTMPGPDTERWEELDSNDRRKSETVPNGSSEENEYDREYTYGSLDRNRYRNHSTLNKDVTTEPQRPTARRQAVVASLPESDLSVLSDTIANLQRNQPIPSQFKRSKWNFKLNFKSKDKERSREQKLEDVLETWKPSKTDLALETILEELKNCKKDHRGLQRSSSSPPAVTKSNGNTTEQKRHNAVWELFTSERTYLIDHLLVLQQVFMEPLQALQCEGYLLSVDVRSLFGNLEELCKASMDFCHALLNVVGDKRPSQFGSADAIDTAFETFGSTMCPPYQRYFSGYRTSLSDREDLKSNEEYILFLEWCERNPRCKRLKLNDFLVAPMQHLTKFPLLLRNIAKYTNDMTQNQSIEGTMLAVQESLKTVEGKVSWMTHFQFLQDLQGTISWPPVYEIDNKTILPEPLRNALASQPCKNLIANPKRHLVLEGPLAVVENGKPADVYAFLFDDLLLLTKPKKSKRKPSEVPPSLKKHSLLKDGTLLAVHRQPIALDRFMVYDAESDQASSLGLKKAFVIVQENRFQQMCSLIMLQASSEDMKRSWLKHIASTAAQWMEKNVYNTQNNNQSSKKPSLSKSRSTTDLHSNQRSMPLQKIPSARFDLGSTSVTDQTAVCYTTIADKTENVRCSSVCATCEEKGGVCSECNESI